MFSKSDSKGYDTKPTIGDSPTSVPSAAAGASSPRPSRGPSLITSDLKVIGNLVCTGDLQVDGTIEGDVQSRSVTVGEGARVEGSTSAESVLISGTVNGAIKAATVRLARTAKVTGDITYKTLAVEEGAVVNGRMIHESSAEATTSLAARRAESGAVRVAQAAGGSAAE